MRETLDIYIFKYIVDLRSYFTIMNIPRLRTLAPLVAALTACGPSVDSAALFEAVHAGIAHTQAACLEVIQNGELVQMDDHQNFLFRMSARLDAPTCSCREGPLPNQTYSVCRATTGSIDPSTDALVSSSRGDSMGPDARELSVSASEPGAFPVEVLSGKNPDTKTPYCVVVSVENGVGLEGNLVTMGGATSAPIDDCAKAVAVADTMFSTIDAAASAASK